MFCNCCCDSANSYSSFEADEAYYTSAKKVEREAVTTKLSQTKATSTIMTYGSNVNVSSIVQNVRSTSDKEKLVDFAKKGKELLDQRKFVQAITFFDQALALTLKIYGPEDAEVKYSQEAKVKFDRMLVQFDHDPYWISVNALIKAAALSNFLILKPIIGDAKAITACLNEKL